MSPTKRQAQGHCPRLAEERGEDRHRGGHQLHRLQLGEPARVSGQAHGHRQLQLCGGQRGEEESLRPRPSHRLQ